MSPGLAKRVRDRLLRRGSSVNDTTRTGRDSMIVRSGLSPAYYGFLQVFAKANRLELVVDRRVGQRRRRFGRSGSERRLEDRRGEKPATWDEGNFVVVQGLRRIRSPQS